MVDLKSRVHVAEDRATRPARWALLVLLLPVLAAFTLGAVGRAVERGPDVWVIIVGIGWYFWFQTLRRLLTVHAA